MTARFAVLIPARLQSTRLPEKVLATVGERTLVQCVVDRAREIRGAEGIFVLTDSDRVASAVRAFGGDVRRTRADHRSGTDRCAEAAADLDVDVVVNLQGDEPLFVPADIEALAAAAGAAGADMATLGHPFANDAQRASPHAVKALVDANGWAVGFQRAWPKEVDCVDRGVVHVWHHLGVYAFRGSGCWRFRRWPPPHPSSANAWSNCAPWTTAGASGSSPRPNRRSASIPPRTSRRCASASPEGTPPQATAPKQRGQSLSSRALLRAPAGQSSLFAGPGPCRPRGYHLPFPGARYT